MAANESTRERIEKMSIILDHVNYVYGADTPLAVHALNDVCLKIPDGQFIGIIGHTGSGKSTLMQHMNGLIRATDGHIYFNGEDIYDKDYDMKKLRSKVGLVFQYPEHQLFEIDVFSDVCFGPKNLGLDKKEVELRAYDALKKVGLPDELFYQSPFELSGGQKRRVAIAGVLAMKPEVLILDEPTAGLDPKGRDEILQQIKKLQTETGLTILLVSHSMEDVAEYVDRIIVMNKGSVMYDDTPREVFKHYKELEEVGLPDELFYQSPFELSGGQKRRVAIAGVLAMKPEVLILDEPTAGLDPKGRDEILQQIKKLQTETGLTILLVSHSMEDVAEYVDRIIVMNKGSVMYDNTPREVFKHYKELEEVGLAAPQVTYIMHELKARGADVDVDATTIEEAAEEIARVWKQNNQK